MQNYYSNAKQHHRYILNRFFETTLDSKEICSMLRKLTVDTFTRMYQYKIINVLYINKMLFLF